MEREKEHAILRACRDAGAAYIMPGATPYMAELQLHKAKRKAAVETRKRRHNAIRDRVREAIHRKSKASAVHAASSTAVAQRGADPPPAAAAVASVHPQPPGRRPCGTAAGAAASPLPGWYQCIFKCIELVGAFPSSRRF